MGLAQPARASAYTAHSGPETRAFAFVILDERLGPFLANADEELVLTPGPEDGAVPGARQPRRRTGVQGGDAREVRQLRPAVACRLMNEASWDRRRSSIELTASLTAGPEAEHVHGPLELWAYVLVTPR